MSLARVGTSLSSTTSNLDLVRVIDGRIDKPVVTYRTTFEQPERTDPQPNLWQPNDMPVSMVNAFGPPSTGSARRISRLFPIC